MCLQCRLPNAVLYKMAPYLKETLRLDVEGDESCYELHVFLSLPVETWIVLIASIALLLYSLR